MLDKKEIGNNIKLFAKKKYGSAAEMARQLNIKPQALQSYIDGRIMPGGSFLHKLKELGCDLNWVLSAKNTELEYVPIEIAEVNEVKQERMFKIAGVVPAGKAEVFEYTDWYEEEPVDYDPERNVFLKVDPVNGYSMTPLIQPGDLVLIDLFSVPKNGDLVAARWDSTGGAIKILNIDAEDPEKVVLTSYNQSVAPIFMDRKKMVLYRVVMIKKKSG